MRFQNKTSICNVLNTAKVCFEIGHFCFQTASVCLENGHGCFASGSCPVVQTYKSDFWPSCAPMASLSQDLWHAPILRCARTPAWREPARRHDFTATLQAAWMPILRRSGACADPMICAVCPARVVPTHLPVRRCARQTLRQTLQVFGSGARARPVPEGCRCSSAMPYRCPQAPAPCCHAPEALGARRHDIVHILVRKAPFQAWPCRRRSSKNVEHGERMALPLSSRSLNCRHESGSAWLIFDIGGEACLSCAFPRIRTHVTYCPSFCPDVVVVNTCFGPRHRLRTIESGIKLGQDRVVDFQPQHTKRERERARATLRMDQKPPTTDGTRAEQRPNKGQKTRASPSGEAWATSWRTP